MVSIHAPARGATAEGGAIGGFSIGFNPRTRTGCDCRATTLIFPDRSFNPRTRTGCDLAENKYQRKLFVSIHAPARGATYTGVYR